MGRTSSASGRWILLRSSLSRLDWKMADEIATPPTWPDEMNWAQRIGYLLREILTYPFEELTEPSADSHLILLKTISGDKNHLMEAQFTYQANGPTKQLKKFEIIKEWNLKKNGLSYWAKFVAQRRSQIQEGPKNHQSMSQGSDKRKNNARYSTRTE